MEHEQKIAGVNRNVFFLGLVSFFNDFSAEMVQSVMPVFLTSVLGAPAFVVAVIEGVADALSSILKLISGWLSDKIRKRKALAIVGYMISVATRPFLAAVANFYQVFGLRVIDRIGKGFRDAPRDALISESVERSELGHSFGFHRSMDTLGATVGPLTAFLVLPFLHSDYRELFMIAFVVGLGAIFSFAFVRETPHASWRRNGEERKPKLNWQLFKTYRKFTLVVLSLFVFGLGTLPISLVLLKEKEIGVVADIPLMYFVFSLSFVIAAVPLGKLADKIGERFVIAGGFLLAALAYFGLSNADNLLATFYFFVILGVYMAATDGLQRVLAVKALPHELLATGQGFLNMAIGFSSLGASIVGGLLWTLAGSAAALSYAGIFSIIGLLLFLRMTNE